MGSYIIFRTNYNPGIITQRIDEVHYIDLSDDSASRDKKKSVMKQHERAAGNFFHCDRRRHEKYGNGFDVRFEIDMFPLNREK